jgi:hypothetical protein
VAAVAVEGVGVMATLIMDMVVVTTAMAAGEVTDGKLFERPYHTCSPYASPHDWHIFIRLWQFDAQSVPACPYF